MTTSGTFGANPVTVAALIDTAFRRCGKLPSSVSGELLLSARNALFFLLSDLANRGLSLWCQVKTPVALVAGQEVYTLPTGTADVLKVMHRTDTVIPATAVLQDNTSLGIDAGYARKASTITIQFPADISNESLTVEQSQDNSVWKALSVWNLSAPAMSVSCLDLDGAPAAEFWRVRTTNGDTLPVVSALAWHELPSEILVSKMNRDDYQNLPNRHAKGLRVFQYWFDKQIVPRIYVWPVPQDDVTQLVLWTQRFIQDPGSLSGTLDIPQRWYEYVIFTLSARLALEMPAKELPPGRVELLEAKSAEHLQKAEMGETDGSPIRLQPNIRGYTR